jgi:hypothetical protein
MRSQKQRLCRFYTRTAARKKSHRSVAFFLEDKGRSNDPVPFSSRRLPSPLLPWRPLDSGLEDGEPHALRVQDAPPHAARVPGAELHGLQALVRDAVAHVQPGPQAPDEAPGGLLRAPQALPEQDALPAAALRAPGPVHEPRDGALLRALGVRSGWAEPVAVEDVAPEHRDAWPHGLPAFPGERLERLAQGGLRVPPGLVLHRVPLALMPGGQMPEVLGAEHAVLVAASVHGR